MTNTLFVRLLGVDESRVLVRNTSQDTEEEARNLAGMIARRLWCSSPRLRTCHAQWRSSRKQGCVLSRPSDYRTGLVNIFIVESIYPNADALYNSERAIYEYLGMLWLKLVRDPIKMTHRARRRAVRSSL